MLILDENTYARREYSIPGPASKDFAAGHISL
jgi:hypothetical protein